MTKEAEDSSKNGENKNANQTVSTGTEVSQTNCKKTDIAVKLKSNVRTNAEEAENDSGTSSGDKVSNEVENKNSNGDVVTEETAMTTSTEKVEEIEEEDVPGDFFDDFLKEDFMDGLDIVDDDAWDEDKLKRAVVEQEPKSAPVTKSVETKKKKKSASKKPISKKPTKQSSSKNDHSNQVSAIPPEEKKHKQKKKKHEEKESEQKPKNSKEKVIDADEFDIRRDPEKTKRDIERDKARCEKDKEKKIISEKLSLVETGLVPPGMEMEIDIEEIKRQKEIIEQNKPPRDLRERLRSLRSKSKSASRRQRSSKRKSAPRRSASPLRKSSPKRRRTRSPIKKRSRSNDRQSPARRSSHRSSPLNVNSQKRTSPRRISPRRISPRRSSPRRISPRRSPLRSAPRRSVERGVGKRSPRRSRSVSPYYRSRRGRYSPHKRRDRSGSRESDREVWLRRRRSRSRSRRRREEKKSFLQELAEKLNETRPQPVNMMPQLQPPMHYVHPQPSSTVPAPVPAPVPPPTTPTYFPQQSQPPPQPQYDPYDQNFFIGTPLPVVPPNFIRRPQPKPLPTTALTTQAKLPLNSALAQPAISPHVPIIPTSVGSNMVSRKAESATLQMPGKTKGDAKGEIEKLFQDKKIKLSEFLAVTAKPEVSSSSPALLQEKIKVISRCQEAIKILGSNEEKYTGKLVVHHTEDYKMLEQKNMSPLIRMPPVVFPFTHQQIKVKQKITFSNFINQLLQKIGMMKAAIVDVDNEATLNSGITPTARNLSPPPPPLITRIRGITHNEVKISRPNLLTSNQLSKMVQTDVFRCEACETRKKILYKSTPVQCGGEKSIYSVSTQVTENDFISKIPVTQSLASLTPAQLLAKSRAGPESPGVPAKFGRGIDKDDFDIPAKSNYPNRMTFSRAATAADAYNLPRYGSPSPPLLYDLPGRAEPLPPSMYGALNANAARSLFIGGGGRGRATQPNPSRTMDSSRFNYNNYY